MTWAWAASAALLVGFWAGTRARRWRRSSYDPKLKIRPPVVKFEGVDESLHAQAMARRKAADDLRRSASAVRSGDDAARFRRKVMS